MAQPIAVTEQLPRDIAEIVEKAQTSWLSNDEVLRLLNDFPSIGIPYNTTVPNRPPGGTLFFFSRQACRNFRKDGHSWRLKNDGRSIRETHEKLKVGNTEALNCYYAHADQDDNLQRRSYWRLKEDLKDLILVHYLCTATTRVNGGRGVRASNADTIAATRPRRASRATTRRRGGGAYTSEEEEDDDDDEFDFEDDEEEDIVAGESSDFGEFITNPASLNYVGGSSGELDNNNKSRKKKLPAREARNAARTHFVNILDSSSSGSGQLVSSRSDELVYKNRQRMQRQAAATDAQQQGQVFSGRPLPVAGVSFQPAAQATQTIFLAHQQQQQQRQQTQHVEDPTTTTNNNNTIHNGGVPLGHRISDPTILRQMSLGIRTISNTMQVSLGPFHEESQELPPIAPLCNTDLISQPGSVTSGGDSLSQALSSGTISALFQPTTTATTTGNGNGGSTSLNMGFSSGGIPRLMSDFRQDSIQMPEALLLPGGSFNFDADGDLPLSAILNDHSLHHPKAGTTFIDRRLSGGRKELSAAVKNDGEKVINQHQLDPSPLPHTTLVGVGAKGSRESELTAIAPVHAAPTPSSLIGQISDLSPLLSEQQQGNNPAYTTPFTANNNKNSNSIKGEELASRASRSVSRNGSQVNLSRRSTGNGAIPVGSMGGVGSGVMMMLAEEDVAAARREKRQAAAASLAASATAADRQARLAKARDSRQQFDTTSSADEEYIAAIGGQNTATTSATTTTEEDEMIEGPNNLFRLQSFLFQKNKSGINGDREAVAAAAVNGLFKHMSIDETNAVAAVQQSLAVSGSLRRLSEGEEAAVAAAATAAGGEMESTG